jgi:hypothetical protein
MNLLFIFSKIVPDTSRFCTSFSIPLVICLSGLIYETTNSCLSFPQHRRFGVCFINSLANRRWIEHSFSFFFLFVFSKHFLSI